MAITGAVVGAKQLSHSQIPISKLPGMRDAALQLDLNLLWGHVHDHLPIPRRLAAGRRAAHFRYSQPKSAWLRCSMHYVGPKCAMHDGLL